MISRTSSPGRTVPLLDAGVTFRAALGNHDDIATVTYPPIHMDGRLLHLRAPERQIHRARHQRARRDRSWRGLAPRCSRLASPGRSPTSTTRCTATPDGMDPTSICGYCWSRCSWSSACRSVFSGHDHVYERLKPQRGIHYFVAGSGGQLRKGDLQPAETTAAGFDEDRAFMLVEISGDDLFFHDHLADGRDRGFRRDPATDGAHRQLTRRRRRRCRP